MHEMQTTAMNVPVCQSVCLSHSFTRLWCANIPEWIEVLFGVKTLGHCIRWGSRTPMARGGGSAFYAAFAKLLWSLVLFTS